MMPTVIQASLRFTFSQLSQHRHQIALQTTHLWHVWIELDRSVYSLHSVHLCRAQPSSGCSFWREPETRGCFKNSPFKGPWEQMKCSFSATGRN